MSIAKNLYQLDVNVDTKAIEVFQKTKAKYKVGIDNDEIKIMMNVEICYSSSRDAHGHRMDKLLDNSKTEHKGINRLDDISKDPKSKNTEIESQVY